MRFKRYYPNYVEEYYVADLVVHLFRWVGDKCVYQHSFSFNSKEELEEWLSEKGELK